jgi:FSR family fosmidomycin resistance protein-like MFS transporter
MKIRSMGLLVLAHAAADINQGSIPVLLPFFIAQHHISYTAAATIVFAVNLVSTLAQPVFGYIVDRRSRPWLIPASMLVIGLGVSFTGIMPTYEMGLATLTITGLGIAVFHPEGARLMNYLAGTSKATAMSLFGIGGQLGFAIGPLIGIAAMLSFGLKGTMVVVIPTVIVAALVVWKMPQLTAGYVTKGVGKGAQVHGEGRDAWPAFICVASALLSRSVIFYGLNTFLPLYWINVLQQPKAAGGTALTVLLASTIAGNFLGGRVAERLGYRLITVASFGLLMALLPFLAFMDNPAWSMFLLIPIGLVLSAPFGPMVALGQGYLPNRVGLASGITLGLAFSFGGLTTPILGWIADHHGLRAAISTVAFMPVICTALTLLLPNPKK